MVNKIGYPDKWRDYSSLAIVRGDFLGNVDRATIFESKRELAKIGKPVDRGEWGMTPTVNAYYNPQMNDINFPAGVLQPPLYDAKGARRTRCRPCRPGTRSRGRRRASESRPPPRSGWCKRQ
jgi:predicted metalloendopeptidase